MKSKSILLIAISLGCGLFAVIGISKVMGRSNADTQPKVEKVPVLVAAETLDALTLLTEEHVVVEEWPIEYVPEGAATSLEQIEGMVVNQRMAKEQTIFLSSLVSEDDATELAIPPGYRVVGIKVSADDHIEGLLQPGDRVDVIGIFRKGGANSEPISQTFLKRIKIFSVNANMRAEVKRDEKLRSSTVVSVLATEKQANQLVLVQRVAELKLVMRGKEEGDDLADEETEEDLEWDGPMSLANVLGTGDSGPENGVAGFLQGLQSRNEAQAASEMPTLGPTGEHTMIMYTSNGPKTFKFDSNGLQMSDSGEKEMENPPESAPKSEPSHSSGSDDRSGDLDFGVSNDEDGNLSRD